MRRRKAKKIAILPDPKFNEVVVTKFVNNLMLDGKKSLAFRIFYEALEEKKYECFLDENTYLPMMYMPDAIRATIELMEAPADKISVRTSYNISGMSFSPKEIAAEIKERKAVRAARG